MRSSQKLLSGMFLLCCFLFQETLEAQTKRLKRPTSRVGITSVDRFVRESFDLYDKVYRYDGHYESGTALSDDDLEILIDAVEDAEGVLASAPTAVADLDGAGVLKQGKGTLQLNRSKKALKYCIKTAKKLLTTRKKDDNSEDEDIASTDSEAPDDNTSAPVGQDSDTSDSNDAEPEKNIEVYSKFDFVPGDKLIFFDDFSNDFIGDFPAKWNTNGSGEVVTVGDDPMRWIKILPGYSTFYIPDVELPEEYTIEFDLLALGLDNKTSSTAILQVSLSDDSEFKRGNNHAFVNIPFCQYSAIGFRVKNHIARSTKINNVITADLRSVVRNKFHVSIAVNKQRFRLWVEEKKYVDIPRFIPADAVIKALKFSLHGFKDNKENLFISNLKVAEGGVDLRRQLINQGTFSTNGILFKSGSATIEPRSYGIIRQVSQALLQVPDMRLNIIGHTDADGSDAANLSLSKKRAAAVKQALVTIYSISEDRLQTDGKGETEPVGDNKTADGKAKNRRVVFIKI